MYSVLQASRYAGVSVSTIRNWSADFAEFLSPGANPPPGVTREYTEDDLEVFATVGVLRAQSVESPNIRAALRDGQRLEPVNPPAEEQPPAGSATTETAITIYKGMLDEWRTRADELAERLIESESARAAAERELQILRGLYEAATSPPPADRRPTFWEWATGRRPRG